jgi:hypothetical protein
MICGATLKLLASSSSRSEHRGVTPGVSAAPVVMIPEDQQPAVQRGNQQIHQRRIQGAISASQRGEGGAMNCISKLAYRKNEARARPGG